MSFCCCCEVGGVGGSTRLALRSLLLLERDEVMIEDQERGQGTINIYGPTPLCLPFSIQGPGSRETTRQQSSYFQHKLRYIKEVGANSLQQVERSAAADMVLEIDNDQTLSSSMRWRRPYPPYVLPVWKLRSFCPKRRNERESSYIVFHKLYYRRRVCQPTTLK